MARSAIPLGDADQYIAMQMTMLMALPQIASRSG
jgi:hypothetical protein